MYHWDTFVLKVVKTTLLVLGALHFYITAWTAPICNLAIGSMGKLVNPFASHAKDPRFEPEWKQFFFFFFFIALVVFCPQTRAYRYKPTSFLCFQVQGACVDNPP